MDAGGNRVQNVASGIVASDAANTGQVQAVQKSVKQYAAIAAASSALPLPAVGSVGETTVGAAFGAAGGYGAVAIGLASRITENLLIRANVGTAGSGSSVGIGIGYTFK